MTLEERIKKISEASGMPESEVKELVEKKKEDAAGLLTDHGAIYALEKEYGLGRDEETVTEYTKLSDLKKEMNNVNIVGVIREIRPLKTFQTAKRSGKLARLVITDSTGDVNTVLWDKMAEIVNSDRIKVGSTIVLRNGYTREGLDKNPEVHVGSLSRILIEPTNLDEKVKKELPKIEEGFKKIGELKADDIASVHGRVLYLYPKSEFERSDGRTGQRASMIIEDETGKVRIVMWDTNADRVDKFKEGDVVKIESGQAREGNRGMEIHIGNRGRILPSDAKLKLPEAEEEKIYKIGEIEPDLQNVNVAGRVMRILPVKEFTTGDRSGKLASLIIVDETGISRVVLWGDKTEHTKEMNQGDIIAIKRGYTKQSLNGESEVHISNRGSVEINPKDVTIGKISDLMAKHATEKKIEEIKPDDRNVSISGTVDDVDENQIVFEICSECGARIENVAGEWLCDVCGDAKPAYGMVVSCGISDGTGDIRCVFYRDLAEELTGMSVADALNMIGQSGDELAPINHIRNEISGREITVIGNIRYNDYQDKLELMASSVSVDSSSPVKTQKSTPKKEEETSEEISKEVLKDEEIEVEEINLDE